VTHPSRARAREKSLKNFYDSVVSLPRARWPARWARKSLATPSPRSGICAYTAANSGGDRIDHLQATTSGERTAIRRLGVGDDGRDLGKGQTIEYKTSDQSIRNSRNLYRIVSIYYG
jgi:hypothetical protein